mgnify:CR=1 FL=1
MAEMKHTPGPWLAVCNDIQDTIRPVGDDGVRYWDIVQQHWKQGGPYRGSVCSVFAAEDIGGITRAERDANAHLISAAPDMLAALKTLDSIERGMQGWHEDAKAEAWAKARAAIAKAEGRSNA